GIIGLVKVGLDCGLLPDVNPDRIKIDTPAGRVTAKAVRAEGRVDEVEFSNVSSFCLALDQEVELGDLGVVAYDLAFGGAYYAFVDAEKHGLALHAENSPELISAGKLIKSAIQSQGGITHPFEGADLGFLYGVIFTGPPAAGGHSRHVCIFADGELDRSPTGTGVSARAAILHARGKLEAGHAIDIESILGTSFQVAVEGQELREGISCIIPKVTGRAYVTGIQEFIVDPDDPLRAGFFLGR
ncbi:MAG: proline racemase family protein, partial [Planctomycetota bacterium]